LVLWIARSRLRIIMTRLLAHYLRYRCFGAVGDHFDGVDQMLALRA
jgi:hypothetical protein